MRLTRLPSPLDRNDRSSASRAAVAVLMNCAAELGEDEDNGIVQCLPRSLTNVARPVAKGSEVIGQLAPPPTGGLDVSSLRGTVSLHLHPVERFVHEAHL
jgi:hypothetical protein